MTGLGEARLCLSWTGVSAPSASIRRSQSRLPSARENASTTKNVLPASAAARLASSARSPCVAASLPWTSRGWFPSRLTPAPICDVTKTRSPLTMGVETPTPASGAFHATFSAALQRTGSFSVARDPGRAGTAPVGPVGREHRDAGAGQPEQDRRRMAISSLHSAQSPIRCRPKGRALRTGARPEFRLKAEATSRSTGRPAAPARAAARAGG